jgi:hypothetical protein
MYDMHVLVFLGLLPVLVLVLVLSSCITCIIVVLRSTSVFTTICFILIFFFLLLCLVSVLSMLTRGLIVLPILRSGSKCLCGSVCHVSFRISSHSAQ